MHLAHSKLEIKNTTNAARSKLQLESDSEVQLKTKLYDMRDDFNFPIVNFPCISICGNIPASPGYIS